MNMSPFKTGLYYQLWLCLIVLYFCLNWHWFFTSLTLAYLLYVLYQLLKSDQLEGAENWNAIIIGAGFSGLDMAIKLKAVGIRFKILEKSHQLGGTWLDNQYPGAACDIASHLYSLSYYLNPWWSRAYSRQNEIRLYLQDLATQYNLHSYIHFNSRVEKLQWNQAESKWHVTTVDGEIFKANFVCSGAGVLHIPNQSQFQDQDKYIGAKFHTALWDKNVSLKGKKVAVVGTGASAVQCVPKIAPDVDELYVFQRTPGWIPERHDFEYPMILRAIFSAFPFVMRLHRWFYFWKNEIIFYLMFDDRRTLFKKWIKGMFVKHVKKVVKDPKVAEKLTPNYEAGCKRVTPSDHYLQAFNDPKVHLITDKIVKLYEKGIVVKSQKSLKETKFEVDVIVLATGFNLLKSVAQPYETIGKNGQKLQDSWVKEEQPRAYKSVVVPGFPNMFFAHGPNSGLGHNTVIFMIECQNNYSLDCMKELIKTEKYKSLECRAGPLINYNKHIFEMMKLRVFGAGGCNAWYTNSKGINWTLWPSDLTHFWWITKQCNLTDFELQ